MSTSIIRTRPHQSAHGDSAASQEAYQLPPHRNRLVSALNMEQRAHILPPAGAFAGHEQRRAQLAQYPLALSLTLIPLRSASSGRRTRVAKRAAACARTASPVLALDPSGPTSSGRRRPCWTRATMRAAACAMSARALYATATLRCRRSHPSVSPSALSAPCKGLSGTARPPQRTHLTWATALRPGRPMPRAARHCHCPLNARDWLTPASGQYARVVGCNDAAKNRLPTERRSAGNTRFT